MGGLGRGWRLSPLTCGGSGAAGSADVRCTLSAVWLSQSPWSPRWVLFLSLNLSDHGPQPTGAALLPWNSRTRGAGAPCALLTSHHLTEVGPGQLGVHRVAPFKST